MLKPFLGPCELPYKFWAQSVQLFLRLLDTNGQTNRRAKYIKRVRTRKLWNRRTTFRLKLWL